MMKTYFTLLLLTSLSGVYAFAGESQRSWMSKKGTMIRATWDGKLTDDKKVSLKKSDGKVVSISLGALSLADQEYVTEQLESANAGIAPKGGVVLEGLCGLKLGVVQELDMIDSDRSSDTYYVHPPCPLKGFDFYGVRYTPKGKIVSSITARRRDSNLELRSSADEIITSIENKYGAKMKVERRYNSSGDLRDLEATLVFEPEGDRGRRSIKVSCVCGDPKYGDFKGSLFVTAKDELTDKQRSVELRSVDAERLQKAL